MQLKTVARDCLYINWAVPVEAAPELPAGLRYEEHEGAGDAGRGRSYVMATALFFRFSGLHSQLLPWIRLSYPQMSLRLYVLDGDDVASVLFARMLVPPWVVPMARWVGRQPASAGRFKFPRALTADLLSSSAADPSQLAERTWRLWKGGLFKGGLRKGGLRKGGELSITCRPDSPLPGPGPDFGNWRRTVDYVRRRSRGYVLLDGGVRRVRRRQPTIEAVPMGVTVHSAGLLDATFPGVVEGHWQTPHSAWLCPEIPVDFELGKLQLLRMPRARRAMATVTDGC